MYRKRKKYNNKKIFLIVFFVIALILGFVANVIKTDRELTVFEKAIKDSSLLILKVVRTPFDGIVNKINESKEKDDVYNKYNDLKEKLNEYNNVVSKNEELKYQLNEMKNVLKLNNTLLEYDYVNATVIERDLSSFTDTLIIDKGEKDNIFSGMPVVVGDGLIGKVISTTAFTSTVRLLTANNLSDKISVKINNGDNYAYGILSKYNKDNNTYIIEGISQNINIEKGRTVTTTGMGDIFPSGIVIGRISGVNTDVFDLAKVLEMESLVDFDNINYVTVLKRGDIE